MSGPESGPPAQDAPEGNEITQIVTLMNEYLRVSYSLVEFDSFSGINLLQKLNDVFAELQPQHGMDVQQEMAQTGGSAATLQRMTAFLSSVLNYRLPNSLKPNFEANFVNGEKQVIYPILHWVLSHMAQNRKRVYLSKYLIPIEVPEDLRVSDDGVKEVYTQYKQLIDEFIQTHRNVEKMKENATDPQHVGKTIQSFEKERDTLKQRIAATREKLKVLPQSELLFKAAQVLRQEQEQQMKNTEQLEQQAVALHAAETKLSSSGQTLKELRRDAGSSPEDMIKKIQEDINMSRILVEDKLPKDITAKQQMLQALHMALHEQDDLATLQHETVQCEQEVIELRKRKEELMKDKDTHQLHLFRQQAALTAQRKAGFHDELQGIKSEISRVRGDISGKEDDLSKMSNEKIPKGEDFVKYVNSLRENYSNYKRMGAELGDLRAEYGVLQRTEELLMQKVDRKEYQGICSTKTKIDAVNKQQQLIDGQKAEQLEKLASIVMEFVNETKEKRMKLAPQILELRNTRQKAQVLESAFQAKKEAYELEQSRLEGETGKLQEDVDQMTTDCRLNESLYHRLNCQLSIAAVAWNRVKDEKDFAHGERKLDDQYPTWSKMFEQVTKDLEQRSQKLRSQKRDIELNHEGNVQQMEWFQTLRKLLECKVNYYKRDHQDKERQADMLSEGVVLGGTGNATVMVL
eukprot:TRINITY_DN20840_c1_g1_i1.p1 TRINITY_DN20840_c1_g1~~TRINITY_DN20840_c1_g1_i1.p1  ORF type:complete len:689 (+),score=363.40 TRINITY_DN20840_c1_g1_i1:212-2278(+)